MAAAAILKFAFFGHNSSTDCPISAKFRMMKQNGRSTRATWQKLQIFKIEHGGPPPFWKPLNRHIWVKNRPILMKFGTLHQILNPVTVTWPKIAIFEIQDGGGCHLENHLFGHYSLTDCPISAKFCMRKQNGMLTKATGQKMQMCKIQDGGRPPFWKSLNRHISLKNCPILMKFGTLHQILNPVTVTWPQSRAAILKFAFLIIIHRPIVRFRRNFVWGSRMACRQRPHDKNCNFQNPTWRTAAILKIVKLPYPIENVGFWQKFGVLHHILNLMRFSKALSQHLRCDK